jgi:2-iminobutanoate/2-iminopropanoate deaminase
LTGGAKRVDGRGGAVRPEPDVATIRSADAPQPLGHYSQAIRVGDIVYCAGQLGLDPVSGLLVEGDTVDQAKQALANLEAVLRAANTDLSAVFKATVYLVDLATSPKVNAIWAEAFGSTKPARVTVEVSRLPLGAGIQIDCIAFVPGSKTT